MAINANPRFAFGQNLTPAQLAEMWALVPKDYAPGQADPNRTLTADEMGGMPQADVVGRSWSGPGKFDPSLTWTPGQQVVGNAGGTDEITRPSVDGGNWAIGQDRNRSTWGGNDVAGAWDKDGNWLGYSSGMADMRGVATIAAAALGGAYANGGFGAGTSAGGTTAGAVAPAGMSGSELSAFLEANAGALAPGGEVAAGYGTTWGVGADGVIGSGATMAADGSRLTSAYNAGNGAQEPVSPEDPTSLNESMGGTEAVEPPATNTADPRAGARGADGYGPDGMTGNETTTFDRGATGGGGGGNGGGNSSPWTVRDTTQLVSGGLRVASSLDNGGTGGDAVTDEDLQARQLRALDSQEELMRRIIGNADMVMPFQREAMDFGLRTAREAYGDYRDDRGYALERRGELTRLQDQAVGEARDFNTEAKREELAGLASADVTRAFGNARGQTMRSMTRMGVNPNDGRWGSEAARLLTDQTLAQAAAANGARRGARAEGRALTDRAAGFLSGAPGLVMQATGAGQGAGASGVGVAGNSLTAMNSGLSTASTAAGNLGNVTNGVVNSRRNTDNSSGTDWGGYGALIGGLAKAYDVWGG